MTRTVLGLSAWCKNKGSSIGESYKEEEGAFSIAKPFVAVVEAIVNKKKRNFLEEKEGFLEKIENVKP